MLVTHPKLRIVTFALAPPHWTFKLGEVLRSARIIRPSPLWKSLSLRRFVSGPLHVDSHVVLTGSGISPFSGDTDLKYGAVLEQHLEKLRLYRM